MNGKQPLMRTRGAERCAIERGDIPWGKQRLLDSFMANDVRVADRLFWRILGVVRRTAGTPQLVQDIRELPDTQRERLWRLAHRWLPAPEYKHFTAQVDAMKKADVSDLHLKFPFGKVRAVQASVMAAMEAAM